MSYRWVLNRAGIINVYQYGEETLSFGGGRLLLRGVNGSGKSTAMNMLLPFLLEADTRRIDAAGEQSGVLRSWMLSGRDEQQPVGYLWLELQRGDDCLTVGCGIRANRSTENVSTWWFVTPRRPGIDLSLVEQRTPLSRDALRATLGAEAVYGHDQRREYRAEVRSRLYGGADIDQHLRLVHVVRSPRVGDRIDLELPGYLEDALPQLSEAALEDAAQPLEDLEEHRRNVEHLARTADALDGLNTVYRGYAQSELHRRADSLVDLVDEHRRRQADENEVRRSLETAEAGEKLAAQAIEDLQAGEQRLRQEIQALEARDAYKVGDDLEDLRRHVATLERSVAEADKRLARSTERQQAARANVDRARTAAEEDLQALHDELTDLATLAAEVGLTVTPPGGVRVDTRPSQLGEPGEVELPTGHLELDSMRNQLAAVRAAAHARTQDVTEVQNALATVDKAEQLLTQAETALTQARQAEAAAQHAYEAARAEGDRAVEAWRRELHDWLADLDQHRTEHQLAPVDAGLLDVHDLAAAREEIATTLLEAAQGTVAHHDEARAVLQARRETEQQTVDELGDELAELQARQLPAPPSTSWQRDDRRACLAELIDFRAEVAGGTRAGLEAALEAAGMLGAELTADGSLQLADGQLVARAGRPVAHPLSKLLTLTVPEEWRAEIDPDAVVPLLASISTSAEELAGGDERTVVTGDGRFRVGVLRGRHSKPEAEHIGVTARRAALERQRAEVAARLAAAQAALDHTDQELRDRHSLIDTAKALRQALPSARPVTEALLRNEHAERHLQETREDRTLKEEAQRAAESAHADAVDAHRRTASTLSLPPDRSDLAALAESLRDVTPQCNGLDKALGGLRRAVAHWISAGTGWEAACRDELQAGEEQADVIARRDPEAAKLATLEDSFGVEYDEIVANLELCRQELDTTGKDLETARQDQLQAHGDVERQHEKTEIAARAREEAEARCVEALPRIREALAVPGLLASASDAAAGLDSDGTDGAYDPDGADRASPSVPVVPDTPEGAQLLARAIKERIAGPEPSQGPTQADGLRQSLRQRRDALGAGWDAEDRQPDESLPIHVEVTGPLGRMPLPEATRRARHQLQQMERLLTAKQRQALRNLLEGLIAREVAEKLHAARELVGLMNNRLDTVTTSHGIGVALRWQRRDDLDPALAATVTLLAKPPDLRTPEEDQELTEALSARVAEARQEDPEAPYRDLIAQVLDYRSWHRMTLLLKRPGRPDERLTRRTALSEGEKKMVSYLPLFAAVAASCDAVAEKDPTVPRFVLLDDAFAKVSEDNHAKLFGLLVELDLDFIATSERLWGTHASVPELAITEVVRDADLGVIVLENFRWDGRQRSEVT